MTRDPTESNVMRTQGAEPHSTMHASVEQYSTVQELCVAAHRVCLDGGVSVSLKQTNTKTNTLHPNTCVSLVLVGTNTPQKTNTSKRW
jgi:hypothetical protein